MTTGVSSKRVRGEEGEEEDLDVDSVIPHILSEERIRTMAVQRFSQAADHLSNRLVVGVGISLAKFDEVL